MEALENNVAIITGGARGIGRAIAAELITDGAHVVIFDKSFPDDFEAFAAPLRATGRTLAAKEVDITNTTA
ncbi:MAG: SDR family NAD(P)-dependent oxidoreductase, partial [Bacteroidetes bacterium]|nr:SDR family NAD(P)-dependent oxidoreductase [Bacteroidota bacterium]